MRHSLEHLLGRFLFGALNVIAAILVLGTLFLGPPAGLSLGQAVSLALLLWFILDCLLLWCRRLLRELTAAKGEGVVLRMAGGHRAGKRPDDGKKAR